MNATIILGIFIALAFALMEFRYFKLKQELQSKTDSVETSAIHIILKTVQLAQDGLIHTVQYLEKANQKRMAEMDTIDAYVLKSTKTLESIDVGYKTMKYFWNEMEKREGVTIDVLNNLRSEYNEILVLYREIKKTIHLMKENQDKRLIHWNGVLMTEAELKEFVEHSSKITRNFLGVGES